MLKLGSKSINSLFDKPQLYNDIDISFKINPITRDINTLSQFASIQQSVENLLQTSFYDVQFHPEIGTILRGMLFKNHTSSNVSTLASSIESFLGAYETRIQVSHVNVLMPTPNTLQLILNYVVIGKIGIQTQSITLNRIR